MSAADEWYRCPDCSATFRDQIRYEWHLFDEHDRLRDVLPGIVGDTEGDR